MANFWNGYLVVYALFGHGQMAILDIGAARKCDDACHQNTLSRVIE
jgi:hypothetical protein